MTRDEITTKVREAQQVTSKLQDYVMRQHAIMTARARMEREKDV
jgi:hypothetical protein